MRTMMAMICAALFSAGAMAGGYNEDKKGDLSDDGLVPTKIKLVLGDNVIAGHFGKVDGVIDRDYFTFKVPSGQQLSAIMLEKQTQVGGNLSFIGVQKGKQVTVDPNGGSAEGLLGWTHFGTEDEGTDLLPAICEGAGAKGCTPPLGPGSYSFWVQETGTCACQYRFTFVVTTPAE
ncbi:MAG TPA: hypothetical protein VGQ91_11330 [Ideonella sp.]|nr:hypothetical protein [Ideonella sp.]